MLPTSLGDFREVWAVDTEYKADGGERPDVHCLVAKELKSGRLIRCWADELRLLDAPPYAIGPDALFVAYYAAAEFNCHLALGWELPTFVLDLCVEFKCLTNGLALPYGRGLLGAMRHYNLHHIAPGLKEDMRQLAMRGGPWSPGEPKALLDYCQTDVEALEALLPVMLPQISLPPALLRGRYMKAVAHMEHVGIPLDLPLLRQLQQNWDSIKQRLITAVDVDYGVFQGQTFKRDRWLAYCARNEIPWPRLPSGAPRLDDETFRLMARRHPIVQPMRELRTTLSRFRSERLQIGADGRNRAAVSPFAEEDKRAVKTGRNAPSSTKSIFGPAIWFRGLIRPSQGRGLAYIDYEQQEFGIAAALSQDANMMAAYTSGDAYMAFAKQAGAVPVTATKDSHPRERALFKECVLATQYGQGANGLAQRIGRSPAEAKRLLALHKQTYPRFWEWQERVLDYFYLHGRISTRFQWYYHYDRREEVKPTSIMNFPMQANGAEMLRLATCLSIERGVTVCRPIHDALLIEAPLETIEEAVATTQKAMSEASRAVLDGFALRSDVKIIRYPDRYMDERGAEFWRRVMTILQDLQTHGRQ